MIRASKSVRTVDGIRGGVFSSYTEVVNESKNTIFIENTSRPHAIIKHQGKTLQLQGNKKDKYGLLDKVNTAIVHLSGIDRSNPKREINKLNKQLSEIKSLGFDIPRINIGEYESVAYVKRKLFTREYW